MSNEIPKPVKQRKGLPDKRQEYLNEWKRLFEEVYPGIVVHLENCNDLLRNAEKSGTGARFESNFNSPKIFVKLPAELGANYLVGFAGNRMFSDFEVQQDTGYWNQDNYPGAAFDCDPKTYNWKKFYFELCKNAELIKKQIPKPPTF